MVNQSQIFTNERNSIISQEEYEEDIARERDNCDCVKAENNSNTLPAGSENSIRP